MTTRLKTQTALATLSLVLGGAASAQELTMLVGNNVDTVAAAEALTEAYTERNPDVTFNIEIRPGGSEGDNIIKTRLATGEMADIFQYNSGSLLQALRPSRTLMPINDIKNFDAMNESFIATVSDDEGNAFGVPIQPAMGGGILYHMPTYEELGLEVPLTWDQFMENNAAIAEATDKAPIIQTYRDSWTSQITFLADFYNVQQDSPGFAEAFTANEAKFATDPAALRGFERIQDMHESGYMNEDFGAATLDDGLAMVASGEGVHYPMLTFAIGAIQQNSPDQLQDVGFFALPGDDAGANGLTVWMPAAFYIPRGSEHPEIAKDFLNFVATPEGCDAITERVGAAGPYLVEGCTLPDDVPPSVSDMLPYFEEEGRTYPALEFLSPVKGPALEQLTVEVGSGIREAQSAAERYDADVAKQARQLGLPNW
ncbi:ABC transporter substrate-binding protein [Allosediminivita pacifica]|uniref:Carbohydrate ABC transporter substrate-binding protein (CUT1 family) n=1 Tax=Allosediminivita pacifica TaxID=1267769 RepID=A0A2T6ATH0_9RHOB|nr:extracellular solute-binding protein [Allosediminivita pacifica]PTX47118.1 carbohydrate ABC transporter substrate-binding protein (CUT1 family) [Allosediminivita pacifica]GGB10115.1 sugar ABC transporter substrate-binding protein [Allosediminivita pacifica]